jgi:hypothetical protein
MAERVPESRPTGLIEVLAVDKDRDLRPGVRRECLDRWITHLAIQAYSARFRGKFGKSNIGIIAIGKPLPHLTQVGQKENPGLPLQKPGPVNSFTIAHLRPGRKSRAPGPQYARRCPGPQLGSLISPIPVTCDFAAPLHVPRRSHQQQTGITRRIRAPLGQYRQLKVFALADGFVWTGGRRAG